MDIRLDLSRHCIETEIKKQYNKAVSAYFKAGMDEKRDLESTIEVVRRALEILNFSHLRTQYPPLAGGTDRNVILSCKNEDLLITIDGKKLKD
jgi:DnaJ-class molecular chaperone